MAIKDEIDAYMWAYLMLTKCYPGAVPVTDEERQAFREQMCREHAMQQDPPSQDDMEVVDPVITYRGADLFVSPDAKELRAVVSK